MLSKFTHYAFDLQRFKFASFLVDVHSSMFNREVVEEWLELDVWVQISAEL
jgi:hypothetical protein